MSEAIIARAGKSGGQVDLSGINSNINAIWDKINEIESTPSIPTYPDRSTILVTIRDSNGQLFEDLSVHCKDGDAWYNYHTNENGQCLFMVNSGSANITAWNFSISGDYKWIDQNLVNKNIDAPVGMITNININMGKITGERNYLRMSNNIYYGDNYLYNTIRFRDTVQITNLFLGGAGGGGGGASYNLSVNNSGGGGGGGITIQSKVSINKNSNYLLYVGSGGRGGNNWDADWINGTAGGTTSAFGYSATGGGGGIRYGYNLALGGTGNYNGGNGGNVRKDAENSEYSNWGGGGGGYGGIGGNPYGGNGGDSDSRHGAAGYNGGGGGGAVMFSSYTTERESYGGSGGDGKISFIIP